jgi:hypothetical protein
MAAVVTIAECLTGTLGESLPPEIFRGQTGMVVDRRWITCLSK